MHKLTLTTCLVLACLANTAIAGSYYYRGEGCAIKIEKLERQLGYAKAYGNKWRVIGLERALSEVRGRCSYYGDDSYDDDNDYRYKYSDLRSKVADKIEKVIDCEEDLNEAIAKGDPKKIAKKRGKLEEALLELEEAKRAAGILSKS